MFLSRLSFLSVILFSMKVNINLADQSAKNPDIPQYVFAVNLLTGACGLQVVLTTKDWLYVF